MQLWNHFEQLFMSYINFLLQEVIDSSQPCSHDILSPFLISWE